jgi:hypothetical protein
MGNQRLQKYFGIGPLGALISLLMLAAFARADRITFVSFRAGTVSEFLDLFPLDLFVGYSLA